MVPSSNDEENAEVEPLVGTRSFQFQSAPQFRLIRILLRLLSLWCPSSACYFERFVYPLLVNLYLFLLVLSPTFNYILTLRDYPTTLKSLVLFSGLNSVVNSNAWFGHIAGVIYFRSRDMEESMTNFTLCEDDAKHYRKRLRFYNVRIAMSLLVIPIYVIVTYVTYINGVSTCVNQGTEFCHESTLYHNLCFSGMFHLPGMYLSLFWIVDLLHITSKTRLDKQYQKFLHWNKSVDDSIYDHTKNYANIVHGTCRGLHRWFQIHNLFLSFILPAFIFIQFLTNTVTFVLLFGGVILGLATLWMLPFYFAGKIEKYDEHFRCTFNELCSVSPMISLARIDAISVGMVEAGQSGYRHQSLTFALRSNVESFIIFLDNVKSGFQVVGFSTKLTISLISILFTTFTIIFNAVKK